MYFHLIGWRLEERKAEHMNRKIRRMKREVRTSGEVQFPIRIGEEACYRKGNLMIWTDKVKRILEITSNYVRLETTSYFYTIETISSGVIVKLAA